MKTLFVVSGGDAPGINNVLGNYLHLAAQNGDTVLGANGGFPALLDNQLVPLTYDMLIPWMGRGGSIIASSRDPVLNQAEAGERIKTILPTGNDGTLEGLYKSEEGYIFAKTGTLSGVVALSGFLYTKKNKMLIFSILVNNHQASATQVRRAMEKFVRGLRERY